MTQLHEAVVEFMVGVNALADEEPAETGAEERAQQLRASVRLTELVEGLCEAVIAETERRTLRQIHGSAKL